MPAPELSLDESLERYLRHVSIERGLAVNTVARAYRELEAAGVVETRGRNGTFVVGTPTPVREEAADLTRAFTRRMTDLGLTPNAIQAMVRRDLEPNP